MLNRFSHFLLLLVAMLLTGCVVFEGYLPEEATEERQAVVPLDERPRLEPVNRNYFLLENAEDTVVGETQVVFAREADTFSDLAREYGLGYDELAAANPQIDPWLPGAGTAVLLPTQYVLPDTPQEGVILNIASMRLFYFPEMPEGQQQAVITYPIGIGRVGWETPTGETTVVSRARDPHWYVPASVRKEHAEIGNPLPAVVPPGPDNPLGHHVLKLGLPGYLIHGTNQPYGVGMRVSHGCVRLYPENIEVLYSLVDNGEKVTIVNQPYLTGYASGRLFIEAHMPLEDDTVPIDQRLESLLAIDGLQSDKVRRIAVEVASRASGVPVAIDAADSTSGFESARIVRNTVELDPDAPTLAEVRAILDSPDDEEDDGLEVASYE